MQLPLTTTPDDIEVSGKRLILTPLLGKRPAAGAIAERLRADTAHEFMEGFWPTPEPQRAEMLRQLVNHSFPIRLRTDLPDEVLKRFRFPTKSKPRGTPFVASYGVRHDRERNVTAPLQVHLFYPWKEKGSNARFHRLLPFPVAVHFVFNKHLGQYLEEVSFAEVAPEEESD